MKMIVRIVIFIFYVSQLIAYSQEKNINYCGVAVSYVVASIYQNHIDIKEIEEQCKWDGNKISMLDIETSLMRNNLSYNIIDLELHELESVQNPVIVYLNEPEGHFLLIVPDTDKQSIAGYSWPDGYLFINAQSIKNVMSPIAIEIMGVKNIHIVFLFKLFLLSVICISIMFYFSIRNKII